MLTRTMRRVAVSSVAYYSEVQQPPRISAANAPLLNTLYTELVKKRKSPCFELRSSQIQVLTEPMEFYLALIVLSRWQLLG